MPKIVEIKQIDGKLWVSIDADREDQYEGQSIYLMTQDEIEEIRSDERSAIYNIISRRSRTRTSQAKADAECVKLEPRDRPNEPAATD